MFRAIITRQPNFARAFSTARPRFAGAPSAYDSRNTEVLHDAADMFDQEVNERAQTDDDSAPKMSEAGAVDMQMPSTFRKFPPTSIIRPYDLSYKSRQEPIRRAPTTPKVGPGRSEASREDLFHRLNLDPLDFACTPNVLNHFITDLGKIQPRYITKLTRKNQRRIGKAVRRAKMMGVIPSFSKRIQSVVNPALINQMQ